MVKSAEDETCGHCTEERCQMLWVRNNPESRDRNIVDDESRNKLKLRMSRNCRRSCLETCCDFVGLSLSTHGRADDVGYSFSFSEQDHEIQ
jgi:hypothetical protein